MLKRNGQPCERSVPDYLGRLTDFEFLAYCAVFEPLTDDYGRLSVLHSALTDLEHSLSRIVDACAGQTKELPEIVPAQDGANWEVVDSLLKHERSAVLLCKREGDGGREFAVVQCLSPNSPLAKARGVWHVQMTSNDARLLLQDFVEGERLALQLYANDVVASARETVEEKYPGQNLGRVIKAISQRCSKAISGEEVVAIRHARKQSERIRV